MKDDSVVFSCYIIAVFMMIVAGIIYQISTKNHHFTKYDIVCNAINPNGSCKNYDLYYAGLGSSNDKSFIESHCFKFDKNGNCSDVINISLNKYKEFYNKNFDNHGS